MRDMLILINSHSCDTHSYSLIVTHETHSYSQCSHSFSSVVTNNLPYFYAHWSLSFISLMLCLWVFQIFSYSFPYPPHSSQTHKSYQASVHHHDIQSNPHPTMAGKKGGNYGGGNTSAPLKDVVHKTAFRFIGKWEDPLNFLGNLWKLPKLIFSEPYIENLCHMMSPRATFSHWSNFLNKKSPMHW